MTDLLKEICDRKREDIQLGKIQKSMAEYEAEAREMPEARSFIGNLRLKARTRGTALITEIKKASPSAGVIRPDYKPGDIAAAYADGGAAALSVLTDGPYFRGRNIDLIEARASSPLPVLRKDFILDPWQIAEARAIGADCILLIMAALDDTQASELYATVKYFGMDVLVEVHNREELDRAMDLPDECIIGINNRDLKTLKTDLAVTEQLAPLIPPDRVVVSESGIKTIADIERMHTCGVRSFLVGESLLKQEDVQKAVEALLPDPLGAAS